MVDEFQNEQQEQEKNVREVGDRVRESVAELCGALDELIEEEDAISNGRASAPSLREQLVDSWQGKSYYERLQNVVDADAVRTSFHSIGVVFFSGHVCSKLGPKNNHSPAHAPTHPRTHAPRQERTKASLSSADSKKSHLQPRKKQPLSSINLNSANYTADGVRVVAVSELAVEFLTSLVRSRCSPAAASSSPAAAAATEEEKAVETWQ
jgi:isocitrate lyase